MYRLTTPSRAVRHARGTRFQPSKAALAAALLTGGLALSAQAAAADNYKNDRGNSSRYAVVVHNQTLFVIGTGADSKLALRLLAGDPTRIAIDVGDDGTADATVPRSRLTRIQVDGRGGNDQIRMDESNGVFTTTTPTTIDGGRGNDTIAGGAGNEMLNGGHGDDIVDGNAGADTADLGAGDDRFIWDPGDGSDRVEGQDGHDVMTFNGANNAEQFDVSANGTRVRFFRNLGTITMDVNGLEQIDLNALGGADALTVNDLSGTGLTDVNANLAGAPGGSTADDAADTVIVNATNGNDAVTASGSAGRVNVGGIATSIHIANANASQDLLAVSLLAGDDVLQASGLAADAIQLRGDGAGGNDVLIGGAGADTLLGSAGDDILRGGPGVDTLDGGPGDNVVIQD